MENVVPVQSILVPSDPGSIRPYAVLMLAQRPWLLIVAAPREIRAVLDAVRPGSTPPESWESFETDGMMLVRAGVGKSAAAGATARWYDPERHAGVLSFGIGGALPRASLRVGDVVLADPSVFADEGVRTDGGFLTLDQIGFGSDAPATAPDPDSRAALAGLVDRIGPVATVSACSGTDAEAAAIVARTGAIAEAMEGAACAMAVRRIHPAARFAEIRVISNQTGDRDKQAWDLDGALARMAEVLGPILQALRS